MKTSLLKRFTLVISVLMINLTTSGQELTYRNSFNLEDGATFDQSVSLSSDLGLPGGPVFNSDGTKFYVVDNTDDQIHQYSLGSPYDLTFVNHDGSPADISSEETDPQALAFNADGTKVFTIGTSSDAVHSYSLTTAYDITDGITYDNISYSVAGQANFPVAFKFSADGMNMFVLETSAVNQYSLSSPYNISSGVTFDGTFFTNNTLPNHNLRGMAFSRDGSKMILLGITLDVIAQFTLTTPYDITGTVTLDGLHLDIGNQEGSPRTLEYSPDGSRLFMTGNSLARVYQYTLNPGVLKEGDLNDGTISTTAGIQVSGDQFTNPGGTLVQGVDYSIANLPAGLSSSISVGDNGLYGILSLSGNANDHQDVDDVTSLVFTFENSAFVGGDASAVSNSNAASSGISIDFNDNNPAITYGFAYDLEGGATFEGAFSVSSEQFIPTGVAFSTDGKKMFVSGDINDEINQYSLGTAFDLTDGVIFDGILSVADEEATPQGVTFNSDGTKMFIVGNFGREVNQYTLTEAFDITSSVSHDGFFSVGSQETNPMGLAFRPDGMKMYIVGTSGDDVNQYSLTNAFDITSGVTFDGNPYSVVSQDGMPMGIAFNDDGTLMFIAGNTNEAIFQYSLSSSYDVTSEVNYTGISFSTLGEDNDIEDIVFSSDGSRIYAVGDGGNEINQYSFDIGGFAETSINLGEIEGSLPIRLIDDVFTNAGGTFSHGVHFTVNNLPAGLTPLMEVDAGGRLATLTFSGNASNHQDANDVSDVNLTFADAAFEESTAASVASAVSANSGVPIDFNDNNERLVYGFAFDLSNVSLVSGFSLSGSTHGIAFNSDGTKMFTVTTSAIREIVTYNLSSPFDYAGGASLDNGFEIDTEELSPTGVAFSDDGMKMFVVGSDGDEVNQYSLTSAYDLSTGVTHDGFLSLSNETTSPQDIAFSSNGMKMFIADDENDRILQYSLSSAFTITSGVTYDGDPLVVGFDETDPTGITFNLDGSILYLVGLGDQEVKMYNLSTRFDITSGVNLDDTSAGVLVNPTGMALSDDGLIMTVVGLNTLDLAEYRLDDGGFTEVVNNNGNVEGSLTIRVFDETFTNAGSSLATPSDYTINNLAPGLVPDLAVAADGKTAILTLSGSAADHQDINDISSLNFTFENSAFSQGNASVVDNATNAESNVGIDFNDNNATLSYGYVFDLTNGAVAGNFTNYTTTDTNPQGLAFNNDGTKMYVMDNTNDEVMQFSLATPYETGFGVTQDGAYNVSSQAITPTSVVFNSTGTKMFVLGLTNQFVYQYSLSTPFGITTGVTHDGSPLPVSSFAHSMSFNDDGSVLFVLAGISSSVRVYQYDLATPYDITAGSSLVTSYNPGSIEPNTRGLTFSDNGFTMFIIGLNDILRSYRLSKPFDVSGDVTLTGSFDVSSEVGGAAELVFNDTGDKMFIISSNTDKIHEYHLNVGGFVEAAENDGNIEGSIVIRLFDEEFANAGGTLATPGDYTLTGVPVEFTPTLSVAADGLSATLTLTGSSTDHQDTHDVSDFTFTFQNSAFSTLEASLIDNSSAFNSGLGIDYRDNEPLITYGSSFDLLSGFEFSGTTYDVSSQTTFPTAMAFSSDGTKMFVLDLDGDNVFQYTLANPFDLSEGVTYDNVSFNVTSEENSPNGMVFSPDGMKMYIIGSSGDDVNQYNLTTPFDISSGVSFAGSPFFTNMSIPEDIEFNHSGTKMYVLESSSDLIRQYSLNVPFEITTGVTFDGTTIDITSEDSDPRGFAFSQDGTRLYVFGNTGIDLYGYTLNIPFDITSGITYDGSPIVNPFINRNTEDIVFSKTGHRMFLIGSEADNIEQFNLDIGGFLESNVNDGTVEGSATIHILDDQFSNSGGTLTHSTDYTINNLPTGLVPQLSVAADGFSATLTLSGAATDHQAEHTVSGLEFTFANSAFANSDAADVRNAISSNTNLPVSLSDNIPTLLYGSAYNLSNASFDGDPYAITGLGGVPTDLTFSEDGTKMFVIGATPTNAIRQYSLGTPFDVTGSVTEVGSYDVSDKDTSPDALRFNPDGTRMYVFGLLSDRVHQYSLSTPFDITSGVSFMASSILLNSEDQQGRGMAFSSDGTLLFTIGASNDAVYKYSLSTPYDVTTGLSYDNVSFDFSDTEGAPGGVEFSSDGHQMFIIGDGSDKIHRYVLDAPYDISSARFGGEALDISDEQSGPRGMAFSTDGNKLYTVGNGSIEINQYTLGNDGFVESGSDDGSVSGELTVRILDDTFTNGGGTLSTPSDYSVNNLPTGFTPSLSVSADGITATLTLSGMAVNHMNSDDVASLQFTFENSAFTNNIASDVLNALGAESNVGIDFIASTETDILTFVLDEQTGSATVNSTNHTVGIEVLFGTDVTALTPTITLSDGASISPNSGVSADFTDPVIYTVTAEDGTTMQEWAITVYVAPNTENDILTFVLNELTEPATINTGDHTVTAEAVAGTDISSLAPSISVSENATISPLSGSTQNFNSAVIYTVTAEDGTPQDWNITITEALASPTDISLSPANINENNAVDAVVGTFSTTDASFSDSHTYTFVDGEGDEDNGFFTIVDDQLQADISFDHESKDNYFIRVQTNDGNGGLFEKALNISISDINEAPTDINISKANIDESNPAGTVVGTLTTIDEDLSDNHIYSLVAGINDNGSFGIVDDQLVTDEELDFETKSSLIVRIQTDDGNGGLFEKEFTINVNDLPPSVTALTLNGSTIEENEAAGTVIGTFSTSGEDLSGSFTYTLISGEGDDNNGSFSISEDQLMSASTFNFEEAGSLSIRVKTDDGNGNTLEQVFQITVNNINDAPVVANPLADITRDEGFQSAEVDLSGTFTDEDGDLLTVSATSSDEEVVTVAVSGSSLILTEIGPGSAAISVSASDGSSAEVSDDFTITIDAAPLPDPNNAPTVANEITDQVVDEGFGSDDIDLSSVFSDVDGDQLTYTASSSDENVATVVITGSTLTVNEVGTGTATITVVAADGNGGEITTQFNVTIEELVTAIDDEMTSHVRIYPNPSIDYLKIEVPEGISPWSMDIFEASGRVITHQMDLAISTTINVSGWKAGLYYVRLINENESTTTKILIQR